MTLSDLEGRDAMGHTFTVNLRYYAHTVWPRMNKFGIITRVGKESAMHVPPPMQRGHGIPKMFWDRTRHVHNNQILHDDQTRWEEKFRTVDHARGCGKINCDKNADARPACCS